MSDNSQKSGESLLPKYTVSADEDKRLAVRLSPRQWEVAQLIASDMPTKLIARALSLSPSTVARHRHSLCKKLGVRTAVGITRYVFLAQQAATAELRSVPYWAMPRA